MLLMGCIYIPATRQFQPSGKRRPEAVITRSAVPDTIRLGTTTLADGLPILQRQLSGRASNERTLDFDWRFAVDPDARHVGVRYSIRTGTFISLCGNGDDTEPRELVLSYDERGVIIAAETLDQRNAARKYALHPWKAEDTSRLFDRATILRLQSDGLLRSDADVSAMREREADLARRHADWERRRLENAHVTQTPSTNDAGTARSPPAAPETP